MTRNKWAICIAWAIFSVLLLVTVVLASVTSFSDFLQSGNGKLMISIIGFLFFISLVTAVMTTVIVGYLEKKKRGSSTSSKGELK